MQGFWDWLHWYTNRWNDAWSVLGAAASAAAVVVALALARRDGRARAKAERERDDARSDDRQQRLLSARRHLRETHRVTCWIQETLVPDRPLEERLRGSTIDEILVETTIVSRLALLLIVENHSDAAIRDVRIRLHGETPGDEYRLLAMSVAPRDRAQRDLLGFLPLTKHTFGSPVPSATVMFVDADGLPWSTTTAGRYTCHATPDAFEAAGHPRELLAEYAP